MASGCLQTVAVEGPLPLWSQVTGAFAAIGGLVMFGWALAALAGKPRSRNAMWITLAAVFAVVLAALPAGTPGMVLVCALGLAAGSLLTAWLGRRLLLRPRDRHERLIGVTIVIMVLSSGLRATYLLTWRGPFESHLMYVPPMMVTPFVLSYLHRESGGRTLAANRELIADNAGLAAEVAVAYASL